jgi:hypothetical protein
VKQPSRIDAHYYHEQRVGKVEVSRPYYLCPHCHNGRFPADVELDIEDTELSPGVRRMLAMVGVEGPSITGGNR